MEFFKQYKEEYKSYFEDNNDYTYYDELLKSLELHSKTTENRMKDMFLKAISKVDENNIEYYVFVLKTKEGFYVGSTNNINKREQELLELDTGRKGTYRNKDGNLDYMLKLKIVKRKNAEEENIDKMFRIQNEINGYISEFVINEDVENIKEKIQDKLKKEGFKVETDYNIV